MSGQITGFQFVQKRLSLDELPKQNLKQNIDSIAKMYLLDKAKKSIIIGISLKGKRNFYSYTNDESLSKLDSACIFEIGSITKIFTATLIANAINKNKIKLNTEVSDFFSDTLKLQKGGKKMTIMNLTNHTSGLATLTKDFFSYGTFNGLNPYKNVNKKWLFNVLRNNELLHNPGEVYNYSNIGFSLVGLVLEDLYNLKYTEILQQVVFKPLKLKSTFVVLPIKFLSKLVKGHDSNGNIVPNWDFDVFAPIGAIKSNADDMVTFLEAEIKSKNDMFRITQIPTFKIDDSLQIGLGWFIEKTNQSNDIVFHSGKTGGYSSFVGFNKQHEVGVVVLLDNNTIDYDAEQIGKTILKNQLK